MTRAALAVVLTLTAAAGSAACRSGTLDFSTRDPSLLLGVYGTLFREASHPECQVVVHDQLLRKLQLGLADAGVDPVLGRSVRTFEGWLAGAQIGLAIPTAMQLGGAQLLDAPLDQAVRGMINAYRFNIDPWCGANFVNECIDDFSQAAVAYGWIAAYEQRSNRPARAAAFAMQAREMVHRVLAVDQHLCITTGAPSIPQPCRDLTDTENGLASGYYEIVSFNHGFEDVAYGIGLMTSLSSTAIALEEAEMPLQPTDEEVRVAWALFREGQKATIADGSGFRSSCFRVIGGILQTDSPCADKDYLPRMFPVKTFYQRVFHDTPNGDPYQFDQFDPSLFGTAFINDGRFAVYGELGNRWWQLRPRLDGYRGAPSRLRAVRH